MSKQINLGTDGKFKFETLDKPNGTRVAPDSPPTIVRIFVNGVDTTVVGVTVVQAQDQVPSNITGCYYVTVPTSSFSVNDQIDVVVSADILGSTKNATICFSIVDFEAGSPSIKTC